MNEGLSKSNNRNQLAIMVVAVLVLVPNTQLGTLVPSTRSSKDPKRFGPEKPFVKA